MCERHRKSFESALTQQKLLAHLVSKTGDTVPLSELPSIPDLAVAWLRTYLGVRGHHDVSDASLSEFLRQQTQGARAQLELGTHRLYAWRDTLYFERLSPNTSTVPDQLTVSFPSLVDWGRYQLAFGASARKCFECHCLMWGAETHLPRQIAGASVRSRIVTQETIPAGANTALAQGHLPSMP